MFDPQLCELGGKALLLENVAGCDFPLCINVFGSYRRMEMALGCEAIGGFEAIAQRIAELTKPQPPSSLRDMLTKAKLFLPLQLANCFKVAQKTTEGRRHGGPA